MESSKVLKKLKTELPYHPATLLLGICPVKNENSNSKRYILPSIHSSSIYNSQDIEMSINRWMDKHDTVLYVCVCVYTYIYVCVYIYICVCVYIHTRACDKKEQNNVIKKSMPFAATQMNLEIIILSEVRKRKTNTIWCHLHVEYKIWHKWTYFRSRNRFTGIENKFMVAKGKESGEGINQEFGTSRYILYI